MKLYRFPSMPVAPFPPLGPQTICFEMVISSKIKPGGPLGPKFDSLMIANNLST